MVEESLLHVAEQVLGGKKLQDIDFGEPTLDLEEKLRRIELAIRRYPMPEALMRNGTEAGRRTPC